MALHKIIALPDKRLRQANKTVTVFDEALQSLIDDMFETMYHANGVGLAAPQIGINLQLAVIDVIGEKKEEDQLVFINPQILSREGETEYQEGCLSIPKVYERITRATRITVKAQDRFNKSFELSADGLLGECIQHEVDHLNGKLFIDLLPPLRREFAKKKFIKQKRLKDDES